MASGDLVIDLIARTDKWNRGLSNAQSGLSRFTSFAQSSLKLVAQAGLATGAALGGLGVVAVKLAADAEATAVGFEVMTGSAEVAGDVIAKLRKQAASTPFEFRDLAAGTKTLLNFGRTSNQVLDDISLLSDVAAGDSEKLKSLALVFGQIAANEKLMGQDLLQLINVGFNPLQQIAARTGESMSELRDRMSKGKIGFEEVRQSLVDATSEGGRFHNMNEKMSQTLLGRWSTLKDTVITALTDIGGAIMKELDLKEVTANVTEFLELFKEAMPAIKDAIHVVVDAMKGWLVIVKHLQADIENLGIMLDRVAHAMPGLESNAEQADRFAKDLELSKAATAADAARGGPGFLGHLSGKLGIDENLDRLGKRALGSDAARGLGMSAQVVGEAIKEGMAFVGPTIDPAELQKRNDETARAMISGFLTDIEVGIRRFSEDNALANLQAKAAATEDGPEAKSEIRTLAEASQESFDVLRANVGIEKVQDKQLKVAQKSEKHLADIAKVMKDNKNKSPDIKIAGFD